MSAEDSQRNQLDEGASSAAREKEGSFKEDFQRMTHHRNRLPGSGRGYFWKVAVRSSGNNFLEVSKGRLPRAVSQGRTVAPKSLMPRPLPNSTCQLKTPSRPLHQV